MIGLARRASRERHRRVPVVKMADLAEASLRVVSVEGKLGTILFEPSVQLTDLISLVSLVVRHFPFLRLDREEEEDSSQATQILYLSKSYSYIRGGRKLINCSRTFFKQFGGMGGGMGGMGGGMGGMGGFGGMDEDHGPSSPFTTFGGMPGGFASGSPRSSGRRATSMNGGKMAEPLPDIIHPLKLSLEEIYKGTKKHLKLRRKLLDGQTEAKEIEIEVLPVSRYSSPRKRVILNYILGVESRNQGSICAYGERASRWRVSRRCFRGRRKGASPFQTGGR